MNLAQLISPDTIICNIEVNSKKRSLEVLADLLASGMNQDKSTNAESDAETTQSDNALQIFQLLVEREKLGSTGMGHGVALPHARSSATNKAVAAFIKLSQGINFDSPDKQATDLIFALLVPEHSTEQHLQILAHLAGLFSDTALCEKLRAATTSQQLFELLTQTTPASQAS